nr:MAG TPA: hypothetical protein [Caudoviricetes sp.]
MKAQRIKAKVKRFYLERDCAFSDCEPGAIYDAVINLDDEDDSQLGKECVLVDGCGDNIYCTTIELEIVEEGEVYETTHKELFCSF